ncbi:MAG TPA: coenzyme F420-0:L-glutamate ligase [Thermomicrobiales bacterium]|nr:coenzyme F420-0:L-glutamate ligase [Thermomicrobiales bacterium]
MTGTNTLPTGTIQVLPIDGLPEITPGTDLPSIIGDAIAATIGGLEPGDVVAVTHKVVSKAEGALVELSTVEPSPMAIAWATLWERDARQVEVVLQQARRIVRMTRGLIIAETRHGFICANAGVDASNVAPDTVTLLPADPDASAECIRDVLAARFPADRSGAPIGVIVTDSFGRPWRNGIVNIAIGVAGISALADYRGQHDPNGYELRASILAVADELAAAAELVMHKIAARPVAVIRGYQPQGAGSPGSGRDLVMPDERNLFP